MFSMSKREKEVNVLCFNQRNHESSLYRQFNTQGLPRTTYQTNLMAYQAHIYLVTFATFSLSSPT